MSGLNFSGSGNCAGSRCVWKKLIVICVPAGIRYLSETEIDLKQIIIILVVQNNCNKNKTMVRCICQMFVNESVVCARTHNCL